MKTTFALLISLMSLSASADTIDQIYGHMKGPSAADCFTRTYSAEHLKAHPAQQVKSISITLSVEEEDSALQKMTGIYMTLRNNKRYENLAFICYDETGKATCELDSSTESLVQFDSLIGDKLTVRNKSIKLYEGLYGSDKSISLSAAKGGDDVFVLTRTHCNR